jgi:amino-acid N-acetyltransferase
MSSALGSFTIRPAGFEDATAIFALIKQYPRELLPRAMSDIVQNIDRFLVAESRGRVVGAVAWQIMPEVGAPHAPSVEIKSLAVAKAIRRKGLGAALVRAAIDRVRTHHPVQAVVLTFAPEFFRSLGFAEVPKAKLMHKIYAGCVNCTKYDSPFTCPEVAMVLDLRQVQS